MTRLSDALIIEIWRRKKPVITWFDVEWLIRDLYQRGTHDGKRLVVRGNAASPRLMASLKGSLVDDRSDQLAGFQKHYSLDERQRIFDELAASSKSALLPDLDFPGSVWRVLRIPDGQPAELACIVDPWCYVSHLSAMQEWGLTNRNPTAVHLTRPKKALWSAQAKTELAIRLADFESEIERPHPRERVTFPTTLRGRDLSVFEPGYLGRFVPVPDRDLRIATVGQTFRDMLHEPALCGGMNHVLEVWDNHAETYLNEIVEALNHPEAHTTKIAFVRAGYIITERLGIEDPRVGAWTAFAERGGSRKLDPERPFEPTFSERWMISLNV